MPGLQTTPSESGLSSPATDEFNLLLAQFFGYIFCPNAFDPVQLWLHGRLQQ
jgi:hypothetical protein